MLPNFVGEHMNRSKRWLKHGSFRRIVESGHAEILRDAQAAISGGVVCAPGGSVIASEYSRKGFRLLQDKFGCEVAHLLVICRVEFARVSLQARFVHRSLVALKSSREPRKLAVPDKPNLAVSQGYEVSRKFIRAAYIIKANRADFALRFVANNVISEHHPGNFPVREKLKKVG